MRRCCCSRSWEGRGSCGRSCWLRRRIYSVVAFSHSRPSPLLPLLLDARCGVEKKSERGGAARRNYLQFPSPASRLGLRYCPPPLPSKLTAPAHTREHLPHRESPGATRQRRLFFPLFPHPDAPSPPLPLSSFATMSSRAEKDKKRATLEELKAARAGGKRDYKVSVDARSFFSASLISRLLLHSLWRTRPSTTRSTNQTTRSLSRDGWQRTTSLRRTTA